MNSTLSPCCGDAGRSTVNEADIMYESPAAAVKLLDRNPSLSVTKFLRPPTLISYCSIGSPALSAVTCVTNNGPLLKLDGNTNL